MQEKSNISYIYGLSESNNPELIRYIGYSVNPKRRLSDHITRSNIDTTKVYRWIKSHREKGDKIIINSNDDIGTIGAYETTDKILKLLDTRGKVSKPIPINITKDKDWRGVWSDKGLGRCSTEPNDKRGNDGC